MGRLMLNVLLSFAHFERARNLALLAVLYESGLRVSAALSLRVKDLHAWCGAIRVLRGMGTGPSRRYES